MPAPGRSPAPSLPPVDDEATTPFSDLFKHGFDPATVDATAQLADRSIFVTSSGRRYRFESIPDPVSDQGRVPTLGPVPTATAQAVPLDTPDPAISERPASLPPPQLYVHAPDTAPSWGRSASTASSHSYYSGAYSVRSGHAGRAVPRPEPPPLAQTYDVTSMMAHMNISRFSATPLYGESDGGAHAAETLTDPDLGPKSPMGPTSPSDLSTTSPRISYTHRQQQPLSSPPPNYQEPGWAPHDYPSPGTVHHSWSIPNYSNYTEQTVAHLQTSRQRAVASTGLPSLLEDSTPIPIPSPHRASDPYVGTLSPLSPLSPASPEKEVAWDSGPGVGGGGSGSGNAVSYYGYYNHDRHDSLHASVSAPPSFATGRQASYVNIGPGDIDTLTPVVVYPDHAHAPSVSAASDGGSTGRDNVLPGEELVFDGPVKSAQTLTAPVFRDGVLKVFRNTLTNDLRFHCKVDRESETYWMKASNAQLVPAYAYDQRLANVVYIRDKESDKGTGYAQGSSSSRPSGIYQFGSLKELFDFQARLSNEKVVLDIGSVRLVTLSRASSRDRTQFSSARLQIWHEDSDARKRRSTQSDVASFVTAGTALSGPLRERLVASSSRVVVYLGRAGKFVSVFITDDLEIKAEGPTLVKLKPRKGPTPFSRKGSRWPWVKAHLETTHGSEPAGFDIHGRAVEVDIDSDYDSYKTFEIEFENSPSQDNFIRKWDEVMRERRVQRERLMDIQRDMGSAVFTGRQARGVFM